MGLLGARVGRALRNRATIKAMQTASRRQRRKLQRQLESGSVLAKSHLKRKPGQLSREDLATRALQGGIVGSLIMALRDRYAGSVPAI